MADVYSSLSFPTIEEDANLTTTNVANHSYGDKILLSTINITKDYYNVGNISFEVYVNGDRETVEQKDNDIYVFCGGRMGISFSGSYTALNVGQNLSVTFSGIPQTETSGTSERDYMQFDIYVNVYQYINTGGEKGNTSGSVVYDNVEIKSFADNIEDNTSQIRVRNYTANEIADSFGIPITQTYNINFYNSDCGYDDIAEEIRGVGSHLYTKQTSSSLTLLTEEDVRELCDVLYQDPTRFQDYTFKGWATSDGGSVVYAGGATFTPTANTDFYAVWEKETYNLSVQDRIKYSGSSDTRTWTYANAYAQHRTTLSAGSYILHIIVDEPTSSGGVAVIDSNENEIFVKGSVSASGLGTAGHKQYPFTLAENSTLGIMIKTSSPYYYYVTDTDDNLIGKADISSLNDDFVWQTIPTTRTYNAGVWIIMRHAINNNQYAIGTITKTGVETTWTDNGRLLSAHLTTAGERTITFTQSPATNSVSQTILVNVTVTFDTDGGEAISDIVSYDTFTAPTATKAPEALSSKVFSFFMNDGTSSIVQSTTVTKYKKYEFVEWEGDDDNYYSAGQVSSLTQNLNLTATYEESTYYDPTTITVPANPTRNGYRFLGWSDTANGTVDSSITAGKTITIEQFENMRNYYYAQWEEVVLEQAEIYATGLYTGILRSGDTVIFNTHIEDVLELELIAETQSDFLSNGVTFHMSLATPNNQIQLVGNTVTLGTDSAYEAIITITAEADGYEIAPCEIHVIMDNSIPTKWILTRDNSFDVATLLPNSYWSFNEEEVVVGGNLPQFKKLTASFNPDGIEILKHDIYLFYVPESYNIPLGEIGWGEALYADDPLILAQGPENNRFYLLSLPSNVTGGDTTADVTVKITSENFEGEVKMNLERD